MTFDAAVRYLESLGLTVTQVPRKLRYIIHSATGKLTTAGPISPHTVVANAIYYQKYPVAVPK